jgi:ribosomal protein S18 acetylase RimI-like enzyme
MDQEARIVAVNARNLADHPQTVCYINPTHPSYSHKISWLRQRFDEGLTIKLLYFEGEKRAAGYIEYVPGENCWRGVDAAGYMFIHCLWVESKKRRDQGWGTRLIREAERDAEGMSGVAVMVSDKAFMASKEIYVRNEYLIAAEEDGDQLLVKRFGDFPLPGWKKETGEGRESDGLTILYSKQCPWVARFIDEVTPILQEANLNARVIELKTPKEAQGAPSRYGVFSLLYNGELLADRYISVTRFRNIVRKSIVRS